MSATRRAALMAAPALVAAAAAPAASQVMALAAVHMQAEEQYQAAWDRLPEAMPEDEKERIRDATGDRAHELAEALSAMEPVSLQEAAAMARSAVRRWCSFADGTPILNSAEEKLAFRVMDFVMKAAGQPYPR